MSIETKISYYSISTRGRALHAYSDGDSFMEELAARCLELAPLHHRWYFQTVANTSIGFLFDDRYVYFAIVKDDVGGSEILQFLDRLRDGFKRSRARAPTYRSLSMHEPMARRSGASIEKVTSLPTLRERPEASERMEDPLLGSPGKLAKRSEDYQHHAMSIDRQRSAAGELRFDSPDMERNPAPTSTVRKISSFRRKWCLFVGIVLALEALVWVVIVILWLCNGALKCRFS